ncbi:coiled-coil domain-containing protein 73 isoform X10 [Numida meleagris]|uniref:coiled-coil domain-containing protein 73 isoform X10 n=1 Tax=Numida meleagris TaxID=8996 RepID=UPI000B3DF873|nr:coiled-coil domain-containing protein 73 isoform X10 [Numida meleagris]
MTGRTFAKEFLPKSSVAVARQILRMDEDLKMEALDSALQSPTETLLSIRLLDFKTSLLEAIEELRIRRETEINYEDQLSKIVVEKQELEWQKETLQHQTDTLQQQNKEAMAAFKKQLQARMFAVEEEKGKYQLAVEIKEKEIDGLKETLKELQISKYALQKKLNEMDQKLQMHLTAREEHHKKLNEVERCYATIACQFGIVKGVHGKLEHSVQEAIQLNKKLTSVNERQETEISHLKEETAVSKRVQEENTNIKEEKLSGQEQSKDSELQTIQKENDCTPSVLRKDSNFGHEDDIEVKNTVNFSLSIEELQIEQKLRVLENSFKDEINVASPSEGKQREASPRNTLCTDTDLITQGQNSEMHVTECKGAENLGTACRALLEENHANLQQKLQDSTGPAAAHHTETSKVLLDATDRIVVCEENAVGEMNSSNQELCNTAHESFCTKVDKNSSITEHNSVLRTEASKKECEAAVCTEKNAVCERNTDNHRVNELHFGILSSAKENSQTESQKCSMLNSDSDSDNRLCRTEKSSLNLIGLPRDKYAFKQAHVDTDDKNYNDNATNIKRSGTLRCIGFPAMDAQNLLPIYRDNASTDEAAKEHSSNMPLTGTYTLCPEKIEKGVNVDDVHSKQAEQDSTEQSGGDRSTCPLNAVAMSPEKADDLEITVQKAPADGMGTDKLNEEIQTQSIKNRHSLEINDNSINNILLKHQKDLLHSTVPGRKFAEGHLKESCSLPMRTSGNLVNVSGRSSFDLSTSDKKAEKTSVRFKFLDFSSCTRVNQMRSQATWTSSSQEPSVLKEKLPCLVENKVISKALFQNVSENAARRETEPGSTSSNGAADTLNTSSMHRAPQGDPTEEWNAIAKTFYDSSFPTEHVKEGFTALNEQKSSPITVTPAQNGRTFGDEDSGPRHNPTVQTQIEEIEKFLNLERICSSRKRKYEDKQ